MTKLTKPAAPEPGLLGEQLLMSCRRIVVKRKAANGGLVLYSSQVVRR